jgi:hypothetical protein
MTSRVFLTGRLARRGEAATPRHRTPSGSRHKAHSRMCAAPGAPNAEKESLSHTTARATPLAASSPPCPAHARSVIKKVNSGHMPFAILGGASHRLTGDAAVARHGPPRRRAGPIPGPVDRVLSPATHRPFRWNPES